MKKILIIAAVSFLGLIYATVLLIRPNEVKELEYTLVEEVNL